MKKQLILSLAFLASFAAQAVGTATGIPGVTHDMGNGHVLVYMASITGSPGCSTQGYRFVIDTNSAGGKRHAHAIDTAKILGTSITITGTGTCPTVAPLWASEYVDYITTP